MTFAREAWPFVLPVWIAAAILALLDLIPWALAVAIAGFLLLLFFRIPNRRVEAGPEVVLAPADGLITQVDRISEPSVAEGELQRIVTFLSVFDVHVQRAPVTGRVIHASFREGRKIAAFRKHADKVNESRLTVIERPNGDRVGVRQIAGLVARRVVGYFEEGRQVERSELLGLIKFGSRVDLFLPASYQIKIQKGDRVRGGFTKMAESSEDGGE